MGIEDDVALLERVPAFATLGHEALRILAVGAESRSVAEGQVLFRAGDVADSSYIVETGSFRLIPSHPRERPVVVRRGTLLGEYALLTETRRPVTATAQELSSVMRITRPLFLRMLEGYPAVALRMRDSIISRAGKMATEFSRVRSILGDPPPAPQPPLEGAAVAAMPASEAPGDAAAPDEAAPEFPAAEASAIVEVVTTDIVVAESDGSEVSVLEVGAPDVATTDVAGAAPEAVADAAGEPKVEPKLDGAAGENPAAIDTTTPLAAPADTAATNTGAANAAAAASPGEGEKAAASESDGSPAGVTARDSEIPNPTSGAAASDGAPIASASKAEPTEPAAAETQAAAVAVAADKPSAEKPAAASKAS